jgi:hypothetical protein
LSVSPQRHNVYLLLPALKTTIILSRMLHVCSIRFMSAQVPVFDVSLPGYSLRSHNLPWDYAALRQSGLAAMQQKT